MAAQVRLRGGVEVLQQPADPVMAALIEQITLLRQAVQDLARQNGQLQAALQNNQVTMARLNDRIEQLEATNRTLVNENQQLVSVRQRVAALEAQLPKKRYRAILLRRW